MAKLLKEEEEESSMEEEQDEVREMGVTASTPKSQPAGTFLKKPETVEERAAQEDGGEEPPVKKPNLEAAENEVDRTLSKSKSKEELRSITTSQGSHVSSAKGPGTSRKVHFQDPVALSQPWAAIN